MNADDIFKSYGKEIISAEGLLAEIDGIECYGLYGEIEKINFLGKSIYKGINKAVFVDKNHDFSYYISQAAEDFRGHFIWGARKITGATNEASGMLNTNMLVFQSYSFFGSERRSLWNYIKNFRRMYSNRWFVPSKNELSMIQKVSKNLNNFSDEYYWSSTECDPDEAYVACKKEPECASSFKFNLERVRLCVQF